MSRDFSRSRQLRKWRENSKGEGEEEKGFSFSGPARLMFFAQKVLAPGHNQGIPEMSNANSPPAETGVYHNEINQLKLPCLVLGVK